MHFHVYCVYLFAGVHPNASKIMQEDLPDDDGDADKDDAHQDVPLVVELLVIVIPPYNTIFTIELGLKSDI